MRVGLGVGRGRSDRGEQAAPWRGWSSARSGVGGVWVGTMVKGGGRSNAARARQADETVLTGHEAVQTGHSGLSSYMPTM